MLNKTYGEWTVIDTKNVGDSRHYKVSCRCSCSGSIFKIDVDNLLSGKTHCCRKCSGMRGNSNPAWKGFEEIPFQMFGILVKGARERNIDVNITISDLYDAWKMQDGKCAISGIPIKIGSKKFVGTASVDRKNSKIGYTKANIQFVHKDINRMKNKYDEDYFIQICKQITEYNNLKGTGCESCITG